MTTSKAIIIAGALIAAAITAAAIDTPRPTDTVYLTDSEGGFFVVHPSTKDVFRCRMVFGAEMHCERQGKHP